MILTIIFILVLLIGLSLFIAVVGTAFLKRNARYVGSNGRYGADRREYHEPARYAEAPRRVYEERAPGRVEEPPRVHSYTPFEPRPFAPPPPRYPSGEGRWFLVTIVVLVVMFFSVFFGVKAYQSASVKPRLFFCETVDFVRMSAVNPSDTFTRGNVTLFYRSRMPLDTDGVRIEVYRRGIEGMTSHAVKELPLKREWTSFSTKLLFDQVGTYTVMVFSKTGTPLAQDSLYIVPDSFAYRAVRG